MTRLIARLRDFNVKGVPSAVLTWSQRVAEQIESQFATQQTQITDLATTQANLAATQADLASTQSDLAATQSDLSDTVVRLKIGLSSTAPTAILSSSDTGTNAKITVAAHTRIYGDGSTLAITGPTDITGLSYGTLYAVYYDDTTLSDTTPAYVATTTLTDAQANKAAGRHFCGNITTATAGGAATSGDGPRPPGGGGPYP